jgi:AcrR family transcriptional regulator
MDDTRQRILEAAGNIFAEKGFHAATVREICQKAGVNIASISYYFGDKERLYIETVKHAYSSCGSEVPLPAWAPGTPPGTRLRDFISTFLRRVVLNREPSWHPLLIMREIFQPTDACVAFVEDFVRPHFQILQGILADLLPAEVPPLKRRLIAFSIMGQCLYYRVARNIVPLIVGAEEFQSYDVDRLTDHITSFTLAALGAHGPRPEGGRS